MFEKIKDNGAIRWIGFNDRRKRLFENLWPLPKGVAYNAYLIVDEKTALIDTVDFDASKNFLSAIESQLHGQPLDYLVINHIEPDHSGGIAELLKKYPEVKVVGNPQTKNIFDAYFDRATSFVDVSKGETIALGRHHLRFIMTPWLHWPETMMTYEATEKTLFSGDAFGSFRAFTGGVFDDEIQVSDYHDEALRYYSNIIGKYSGMVQKAIAKLSGVEIQCICPTHGPVWRSNPNYILNLYDRWSRYEAEAGAVVIFASMYGHTEAAADYIARKIALSGVKNIKVHDVSRTHLSYLLRDIWRYSGLVLGSCSYNSEMFPLMEQLCRELEHAGVKNKSLALFGSYSWNGGGLKNLLKFANNTGLEQVAHPVEFKGAPTAADYAACDLLAHAMAEKLLR
ncbi:MAG: FprA family A-type flavoprotein [Prevotellaceae bacterium]|jgi:flavorubredoxin|nr:FprA family A-type flavoprotein [Prevotellaceae bacterium]